jgi:TolA-binding protein
LRPGFADRILNTGISQAMTEAAAVHQACPEVQVFSEPKINQVANDLTAAGRVPEAIKVLEANVQLFPRSFLAPYWLAETQLAAGDTAAAIVNYRRSVANDPAMLDAIDRLKSLHAWP